MIIAPKKYAYLLLLALCLAGLKSMAQLPMSTYYMENLPQSNMLNAAMKPRANAYIGVPLISNVTNFHTDISVNDLVQINAEGIPVTLYNEDFDYSKLYSSIGKTANIDASTQFIPLMFGFKTKRGYFTFSMAEKASISIGLPKDIFKFGELGIPDNTTYDFSTLNFRTMYYREFSLGYSLDLSKKLTVGAHFKPLFGKAAISTDINQLIINTNTNSYAIQGSGNIYSSLPIEVYAAAGEFPDSVKVRDMELKDLINEYGTSFSNPGFAVDLGAVYKLNDRWSFSAALNNLGYIKWKEDLNSMSFTGDFSYEGVDIGAKDLENIDDALNGIADSIKSNFTYTTGNDHFTTGLSPILYAGSSYYVNHAISLGFISRSMFQKYNFRQEFNLSSNINLYRMFTLSLNYNINLQGTNYAGLGLAWYLGPLQFYVLADHIPTTLQNYTIEGEKLPIPDKLKSGSFMFGMNFVFGSKGFRDKPMINSSN